MKSLKRNNFAYQNNVLPRRTISRGEMMGWCYSVTHGEIGWLAGDEKRAPLPPPFFRVLLGMDGDGDGGGDGGKWGK